MATFSELQALAADAAFGTRIAEACLNVAKAIMAEPTPTNPRKTFLRTMFNGPENVSKRMLWPLLIQNQDFTAVQITGATDAAIESAVSTSIVTIFAD